MVRLDKLVARNLGCSRAEAKRLIDRGDVIASPEAAPTAEFAPTTWPITVRFHGQPLELYDEFHLLLNKPLGVVTALSDARHPTAAELIRGAPLSALLRPVGRLDLDTAGLLLWTTDTQWLHRQTHPKYAVPRVYQAGLARPFRTPPDNFALADGHRPAIAELRMIEGDERHPSLARPAEARVFASITLVGGAYHEVRRIFAALGSHVLSLCRTQFGAYDLPRDLAPGRWQNLVPVRPPPASAKP